MVLLPIKTCIKYICSHHGVSLPSEINPRRVILPLARCCLLLKILHEALRLHLFSFSVNYATPHQMDKCNKLLAGLIRQSFCTSTLSSLVDIIIRNSKVFLLLLLLSWAACVGVWSHQQCSFELWVGLHLHNEVNNTGSWEVGGRMATLLLI